MYLHLPPSPSYLGEFFPLGLEPLVDRVRPYSLRLCDDDLRGVDVRGDVRPLITVLGEV